MKESRQAQGAGRKASGERTGSAAGIGPAAGGRGTGTKGRTRAARLIPVEALRPLAGGGPIKKRKQCPDCRYCQGCSQDRCRLCRTKKKPGAAKLTLAEQIALYEKINKPKGRKPVPGDRS